MQRITPDIDALYVGIINYLQNNTPIAIALAGVLLLLLFKKTKLFFIILFIVALNVSLLYVISGISAAGAAQKEKLVHKSAGQMIVP